LKNRLTPREAKDLWTTGIEENNKQGRGERMTGGKKKSLKIKKKNIQPNDFRFKQLTNAQKLCSRREEKRT